MTTSCAPVDKNIIARFERLAAGARLAHTYLFTGPARIGKSETALVLAKAINGGMSWRQAKAGVTVEEVEKIKTGDPDIHFFGCPYGESIKIETLRDILERSRLRPYQSPKSIFIVQNIDQLTFQGAPALLKTLEEPTADCLFFLTTSAPDNVLATIRSRCQTVPFAGGALEAVAAALRDGGCGDDEARFLAGLSEGSLGRALYLKERGAFAKKNAFIDEFIFSHDIESFVKEITTAKEETKLFLDVLLSWARDCLMAKSGAGPDAFINRDRQDDILRFQGRFSADDVFAMYKDVVEAQKQLAENLNLKIPIYVIKEMCHV